jgi:hypothetical protein
MGANRWAGADPAPEHLISQDHAPALVATGHGNTLGAGQPPLSRRVGVSTVIGTPTLVRARDAATESGVEFRVSDPSPPLCRVAELCGLEGVLGLDG